MTNHAPEPKPRKRLLPFTLLTIFLLTAAWVAYFLVSFDLNNYRKQAEEQLATLVSLAVKIGGVDYNFHDTNLALKITDLQIGDENSTVQINAPKVLLNLRWRGLLKRDFEFTKISVVQPQIWMRPGIYGQAGDDGSHIKGTPLIIDQALLHKISINTLTIDGGAVHIEASRAEQPVQQFDLTEIDGEVSALRLNDATQFTINGDLSIPGQSEKSHWQLQGESSLGLDEMHGLKPHVNLAIDVKTLDLSAVSALFVGQLGDASAEGIGDLKVNLEGSTASSLEFQVNLASERLARLPGSAYTNPISFKSLQISGQLQPHGNDPGIDHLALQLDKSHLSGSIHWTPPGQPFLAKARLLNSTFTILQLKQWIPEAQESIRSLRQNLQDQGGIQVDLAEFTLSEDTELKKKIQVDRLKGVLQQISWDYEEIPTVEITSLPFDFTANLWKINNGQGKLGSLPLTVNGSGEYLGDTIAVTSLDFTGEALPEKVFEEWQIPQQSLSTDGHIAFNGHLEGPLSQLNLDFQADLSQFSISHPAGLTLFPEADDTLALHGTFSPQKITIEHGSIKWAGAKGHLSGTFPMENTDSLTVDALFTINDLTRLAETLPLLKKLQLSGQADLSVSQRGLPEKSAPEMILTLRDAGLHATRYIADLSHIDGRIALTPNGLAADNLRVRLGESPLTVQAKLEDFTNPRLLLNVKAPSIRADELIFYSEKAHLRDIIGQLEIDRDGLTFAPVDVRLDGGTQASVRGTISFHPPFDVLLDITSEFALLSEVINLWAHHSERPANHPDSTEVETGESSAQATIRINAQVKNGDLYGMAFHDASGIIVPSHKRLMIHPLDFSVGEGFCNTQVLIDFYPEAPSVLRISGHAEGADAFQIYRELLNQKNILRGTLRGDFYLSGEIGANYLPSSYGRFNVQIHNGVLRQFQTLSKVFSLLNVSQIFALRLPDMNLEGMPFDTLTANFNLDKGILRSEDLKIQSEAMNQSYIGQVNLVDKEVDFSMAIHPLGTVDKIVSRIPVAGWLLTGENKALLSAHFSVKGKTDNLSVSTMPLDTLSEPTIGLLRRTLGLPFKLIEDPQILWGGDGSKQ